MEDAWLSSALATVRASGATGRERKRLEDSAFRTSRRCSSDSPSASDHGEQQGRQQADGRQLACEQLQLIIDATGMDLPALKGALRDRGGRSVASRLGAMSKPRNLSAHPVSLEAVLAILSKDVEEATGSPVVHDIGSEVGSDADAASEPGHKLSEVASMATEAFAIAREQEVLWLQMQGKVERLEQQELQQHPEWTCASSSIEARLDQLEEWQHSVLGSTQLLEKGLAESVSQQVKWHTESSLRSDNLESPRGVGQPAGEMADGVQLTV